MHNNHQWLLTMTLFDEIAYDLCGYVALFADISIFIRHCGLSQELHLQRNH